MRSVRNWLSVPVMLCGLMDQFCFGVAVSYPIVAPSKIVDGRLDDE
jgi:hypothetical protein